MAEYAVLHYGSKSDSCRAFQAAMNRRLRARDLDSYTVKEDGVLGPKTLTSARKAAWALGALSSTYEGIVTKGKISVGVQRIIRNPGKRNDRQQAAAKARMSQLRAERKKRDEVKAGGARGKAVNAFLAKVGTVERPPNSNSGPYIDEMQKFWGFGHVAWCGIAFGYHATKFGEVSGLRSDVASVDAIEVHARRGDSPYGKWVDDTTGLLQGSAIVIGGRGVHVAMKIADWGDGGAETVEGNTSFGPNGSQSNGGCIAHRFRTRQEIHGGASMNYPN